MTYDNYIGTTSPGVIQFENANEGRSYPFEDNSVLESDDGKVLPDEVIADMHLVVPKGMDARLSSVYISENMVSLCVVAEGQSGSAALSVVVKVSAFKPYVPYRLEKLTGSEDVGGVVTFGQIDFAGCAGSYRFGNRVHVAEGAVSRYTPARLRRIVDQRTGKYVSGDVTLEFPSYIEVEKSEDGVRLSLAEGANDRLLSKCDRTVVSNPCGSTPITSINGVLPDEEKRIVLWFH